MQRDADDKARKHAGKEKSIRRLLRSREDGENGEERRWQQRWVREQKMFM